MATRTRKPVNNTEEVTVTDAPVVDSAVVKPAPKKRGAPKNTLAPVAAAFEKAKRKHEKSVLAAQKWVEAEQAARAELELARETYKVASAEYLSE